MKIYLNLSKLCIVKYTLFPDMVYITVNTTKVVINILQGSADKETVR